MCGRIPKNERGTKALTKPWTCKLAMKNISMRHTFQQLLRFLPHHRRCSLKVVAAYGGVAHGGFQATLCSTAMSQTAVLVWLTSHCAADRQCGSLAAVLCDVLLVRLCAVLQLQQYFDLVQHADCDVVHIAFAVKSWICGVSCVRSPGYVDSPVFCVPNLLLWSRCGFC